ncbi:cytochrome P450 [Apiospora phragmitis]|uniref:Cytochrome P450 n=1 Tax=Apiospora phragmitis TaxID=2905665 RepID=A0ABR1X5L0_9PEZI
MAFTEALYQLASHPLRNYPGPFLAKFIDAYGGYHAVKKRLHLATYDGHRKYGPVFRPAPNRLVFNTVAAYNGENFHWKPCERLGLAVLTIVPDFYLNPSTNKAQIYRHSQFNPQHNIFGSLDKERHRQKRKVYGRMLSERSLRIFEPTMIGEIETFLNQLVGSGGEPVNMTPMCECLTADVAGELAFGQPLHTQTETTNRVFPRAMLSMNFLVSLFMTWPALSTTWPLLRRLNQRNGAVFSSVIERIIAARMKLPRDARHDFYSICADSTYSEEEGLGQSELWAEAVFILPAGALFPFPRSSCNVTCMGSGTSWSLMAAFSLTFPLLGGTTLKAALSAVFFYLSHNPDSYRKLATEIRTRFSLGSDIQSGPQLSECKYLRAMIDESMRLSPPFLGTFWREQHASSTEPLVVDGRVIPAGITVGVNLYCLMHNEAYFSDAFSFKPERWLAPEEGEDASGEKEQEAGRATMRKAFAPFSLGEASCLGKGMAYLKISLTLAKTLWCFDFEKAPGELGRVGEGHAGMKDDARRRAGEYRLFDISTADHDGPYLVFRRRA